MSTARLTPLQYVPGPSSSKAWQPVTFAGSAAFARASFGRLLAVALLFAALLAGASVWFLSVGWWPVMQRAIARLPGSSEINDGRLVWPPMAPMALADNNFLAIRINPTGQARFPQNSDVRLEFGPEGAEFESVWGSVWLPYPHGLIIGLNRTELEPLWGAWQHCLLSAVGLAVVLGLMLVWLLVGLLLALPVWAYAWRLGRQASLAGCWRLATATCLPGALALAMVLFLYGHQRLTLGEMLAAGLCYPLTVFVYLIGAPRHLPGSNRAKAAPRPVQTSFLPILRG